MQASRMDLKERANHRLDSGLSPCVAAGIILAAGSSTRMNRPKQLLPFGNNSLLEHIIQQTCQSDLDKIILVLGHRADEIQDSLGSALTHPRIRVIRNTNYEKGMSSSIQAGLTEIEHRYDHMMILLADMPFITGRLINLLFHRYAESGLPLGASPTSRCQGPGHWRRSGYFPPQR